MIYAYVFMMRLAQAGTQLGPLLVLERLERLGMVRLTRKASLLAAAASLPRAIADVTEGRIAPGYVASMTPDAVFVRFLNGLTGRAGATASSSHGHAVQAIGALASTTGYVNS